MAQQPKKKNVAALSYSSLHEKLGESNRLNTRLKEKCTVLDEELGAFYDKCKRLELDIVELKVELAGLRFKRSFFAAIAAGLFVALVFTLTK